MHYAWLSSLAFFSITSSDVVVVLLLLVLVTFLLAFIFCGALRKRSEKRLLVETRAQALMDRLFVGVFRASVDGRILACNPAAARIFGFANQEAMMAANAWELSWDREDRAQLLSQLRKCQHLPAHEALLRRVDGQPLWVLRDVSLQVENGQEVLEEVIMDWGAARKAQEEARLLAHALRSISECVSITDTENRILLVNDAFCHTYGYEEDEVLGQNIGILRLPDDPAPSLAETLAQTLAGGFHGEVWNHKKSCEPLLVRLDTWVVRDEEGLPLALIGVARDITSERQKEHSLREAQKLELLGTLVGGIAHDFKNLLQAQLSLVQTLIDQQQSAGAMTEELRQVEALIHRGSALCRKLLLFARKGEEGRSPLDLNAFVTEELRFLARLLPENIRLTQELAEGDLVVEGNWQQLSQVLMNLVVNAKDAMPNGGVLTVRTRSKGEFVGFQVANTGVGISEEAPRRLFEPFFTTKPTGQGTGLGLSVVHGIVVAHGGTVEVTSHGGAGSSFGVWLPRIAPTRVTAEPTRREAPPPPRGYGQLVLLVEDEPVAREALAHALQEFGSQVRAASSGEEALTGEDLNKVAVLLADFSLPGINGLELAAELRRRYPKIKILLMSGYGQSKLVSSLSLGAAVAFLDKPFSLWELTTTLAELTTN